MQSSYWKIQYGPETHDDETEHVAHVINKALRRLRLHGFVQHVWVYILKSQHSNEGFAQHSVRLDNQKDVVALVKVADDTTLLHLRMRLTLACIKYESLFKDACRYEPLEQTQFHQLMQECYSKQL